MRIDKEDMDMISLYIKGIILPCSFFHGKYVVPNKSRCFEFSTILSLKIAQNSKIKASLSLEIAKKRESDATAEKFGIEYCPSSFSAAHIHFSETGQIFENFHFRFHSYRSGIVIRRASQKTSIFSFIPEFLPATNR